MEINLFEAFIIWSNDDYDKNPALNMLRRWTYTLLVMFRPVYLERINWELLIPFSDLQSVMCCTNTRHIFGDYCNF